MIVQRAGARVRFERWAWSEGDGKILFEGLSVRPGHENIQDHESRLNSLYLLVRVLSEAALGCIAPRVVLTVHEPQRASRYVCIYIYMYGDIAVHHVKANGKSFHTSLRSLRESCNGFLQTPGMEVYQANLQRTLLARLQVSRQGCKR